MATITRTINTTFPQTIKTLKCFIQKASTMGFFHKDSTTVKNYTYTSAIYNLILTETIAHCSDNDIDSLTL